jgi:hypothetical protein
LNTQRTRSMGIFAHNESSLIRNCLEQIAQHADCSAMSVFVLTNGCTDDTVEHARAFAKSHSWVHVEDIKVGDKSNAWNVYMHELAPDADTHFFHDGDCGVLPGSLDALESALADRPDVRAVSAVPSRSIPSTGAFRRHLLSEGGLAGNLYALPRSFVERIRTQSVRLPVGFIGDDSLVGALACWDLDPRSEWDASRIFVCEAAEFVYEPLVDALLRKPSFYLRRKRRYSLRHFQNRMIGDLLTEHGLSAMPSSVTELYRASHIDQLRPRFSVGDFLFDRQALRSVRQSLQNV